MVKMAKVIYSSVLESTLTFRCSAARNFHYSQGLHIRLSTDMFHLPLNFESELTPSCQEHYSSLQFLSFAI